MTTTQQEPRYYVRDKFETQNPDLGGRKTMFDPRYLIIDRETNLPVDGCTTKRAATIEVKSMNTEAQG
mgnify:CR=1 FL=1